MAPTEKIIGRVYGILVETFAIEFELAISLSPPLLLSRCVCVCVCVYVMCVCVCVCLSALLNVGLLISVDG